MSPYRPGVLGRGAGIAAAVLLSLSVGVGAASAEHGNDSPAGDPDNGDHYIDRNSLSSAGDTAAVWGRDQLNRARDMNATFTGSGDVEIYDGYYGSTGWYGLTSCPGGINWLTGNCDVFDVQFNQTYMASESLDHWRMLGCHELGHTAGLAHRTGSTDVDDNSCMRTGMWPRTFDGHDLDAINSSV